MPETLYHCAIVLNREKYTLHHDFMDSVKSQYHNLLMLIIIYSLVR